MTAHLAFPLKWAPSAALPEPFSDVGPSLMKRRIVVFLVFVLALLLCAAIIGFNFMRDRGIAAFFAKMQPPPQTVSAVDVATREWTPGIVAIGTARAVNGVELAVQIGGLIKEVRFKANQSVTAGEVMVQIDDAIERADLTDVRAVVALNETTAGRARELTQRGVGTQAAQDQAVAQLATARSRLARTTAIIDQKALKAPFTGVIGIPRVDVGQYVQPGTVVATLQDLRSTKVDFSLPEQQAALVNVGQPVRFGLAEGELPFAGKVTGVDPRVDPQTRLVAIQASLDDNREGQIRPGRFLHVRIDLPREPNVLTVPQTAVVTSLYGDYVYVVNEDKTAGEPRLLARQAFVKIGRREGSEAEIVSGLAAGQKVVASGQNKLQQGTVLKIDNAYDPAKAAAGTPRR